MTSATTLRERFIGPPAAFGTWAAIDIPLSVEALGRAGFDAAVVDLQHGGASDTTLLPMTVEAGCIVQRAQEAAEAKDAFFPLDLGSRGSATIDGAIAANAGGNRVLRWGMMTGLEAVLADGTVVSALTPMIKNNAGYAWKYLMIGSEGTLGIVTRAVLRLRPHPTTDQTALVALGTFDAAVSLLRGLEVRLGGRLSLFELMWGDFNRGVSEAQRGQRAPPMVADHAFYALVEMLGGDPDKDGEQFEQAIAAAIAAGTITDAVIARSGKERDVLRALRDDVAPALAAYHPFTVYNVSMALGAMPTFVADARVGIEPAFPAARMLFYGHAGDGNLHLVVNVGDGGDAHENVVDTLVYEAVRRVRGSIAAEHGVGVCALASWRTAAAPRRSH